MCIHIYTEIACMCEYKKLSKNTIYSWQKIYETKNKSIKAILNAQPRDF